MSYITTVAEKMKDFIMARSILFAKLSYVTVVVMWLIANRFIVNLKIIHDTQILIGLCISSNITHGRYFSIFPF